MRIGRPILTSLTTLAAFAGMFAFTAAPASASLGFKFEQQLNDEGTFFGGRAHSVVVDPKNGDILVPTAESRAAGKRGVEVLTPTGAYLTTLTGTHTPAGELGINPNAVAVNDATGDLYVTAQLRGKSDTEFVVEILELEEVDNKGKVEVDEKYVGQLTGVSFTANPLGGVAVDQVAGDVYVLSEQSREIDGKDIRFSVIDEFNSAGAYQSQITEAGLPPEKTPSGRARFGESIAVDDATNELLIGSANAIGSEEEPGEPGVYVYSTSGVYQATWDGRKTPAGSFEPVGGTGPKVAADNATGYVFVAVPSQGVVDVFDPADPLAESYEGQITGTSSARFGNLQDVFVDQASGREYVLDEFEAQDVVDEFGAPVRLPTLSVGVPSGVEPGGDATLNGAVNPEGTEASDVRFEYGSGSCRSFASTVIGSPPDVSAGFGVVPVSALLTGLAAGSEYCYRLAVSDVLGAVPPSIDQRLVTAPELDGGSVSGVSQFAATLHASVEPGEVPTSYRFVYGPTAAYGSVVPTPAVNLTVARGHDGVSQALTGLSPGVEYHYAIQASSAAGTFTGPEQTFTTPVVPAPTVSTGGASGVAVGQATLSGSIDPEGWDSTYGFQYGTSTGYGSQWPTVPVDLGGLSGAQPVSVAVQNLLPGTTYHYRLVASNAGGTSYGADETFTTGEYPASIVQSPVVSETFTLPSEQTVTVTAKANKKKKTKAGKPKCKSTAGKRKCRAKGKQTNVSPKQPTARGKGAHRRT